MPLLPLTNTTYQLQTQSQSLAVWPFSNPLSVPSEPSMPDSVPDTKRHTRT